jgi:ribose transport system permease protein
MQLKSVGICLLLFAILLFTSIMKPTFMSAQNVESLVRWTSLFGFCAIGVAFVIITGGIDLSIGSVIGLSGCLLILLLDAHYVETTVEIEIADLQQIKGAKSQELTQIEIARSDYDFAPDDRFRFVDGAGSELIATVLRASTADNATRIVLREPDIPVEVGTKLRWSPFQHRPMGLVIAIVMGAAMLIGLVHGLLITKLRLQPFVVTLCGLLIYRGLARVVSDDQPLGFQSTLNATKDLFRGDVFSLPIPLLPYISQGHWGTVAVDLNNQVILDPKGNPQPLSFFEYVDLPVAGLLLIIVCIIAWVLLNLTVFGRHLMAMGNNLNAAKFSGVNTDRITIISYVLCSAMAGLSGILFAFDLNSVEPANTGEFYELYAIAAAVLGGCSLRGGSGSIIGVVIGTAVMRSLYLAIQTLEIPRTFEFIVIGSALLLAVLADELIRLATARRQLRLQRKLLEESKPPT